MSGETGFSFLFFGKKSDKTQKSSHTFAHTHRYTLSMTNSTLIDSLDAEIHSDKSTPTLTLSVYDSFMFLPSSTPLPSPIRPTSSRSAQAPSIVKAGQGASAEAVNLGSGTGAGRVLVDGLGSEDLEFVGGGLLVRSRGGNGNASGGGGGVGATTGDVLGETGPDVGMEIDQDPEGPEMEQESEKEIKPEVGVEAEGEADQGWFCEIKSYSWRPKSNSSFTNGRQRSGTGTGTGIGMNSDKGIMQPRMDGQSKGLLLERDLKKEEEEGVAILNGLGGGGGGGGQNVASSASSMSGAGSGGMGMGMGMYTEYEPELLEAMIAA